MSAEFSVWAPFAGRVELVADGERQEMTSAAGGWWRSAHAAPPGIDYGFALDGGDPLPDPRSAWQPNGVHGLSRTVDHGDFDWEDAGWRQAPLSEAVIYELHIGTFTPLGTFDAAIERLPYLAELGVTHLELMPVAEFSGDRGWGYDGVDLFAPHHAYGGPLGLKRLVAAAHEAGLAVLMDVVYNHLGPEGNYLRQYGPYFSSRYRTAWGDAVNFDGPGSDEVRRFVVDHAVHWLTDYHVDGLRLDAVHAIYDASATHIGEEISATVAELARELGRPLIVTVESDANDPRLVRPIAEGGYGLDATWADDLHHALHAALTGERGGYYGDFPGLDAVAASLSEPFMHPGAFRRYRNRSHGRSPAGLSGDHFVVCLQNHDQVGNRAHGERIGQLVGPDRQMIGAALLLTAPYVPLLFSGEEWNAASPFPYFTGHSDPDLAAAVRRSRVKEFAAFDWDTASIPDPQDPATLASARLDWSELEDVGHDRVLAWYRALIRLRRQHPGLGAGDPREMVVTHDADAGWIRVERGGVGIAANLGTEKVELPAMGMLLLASADTVTHDGATLHLPPNTVAVGELPRAG
jgi:maltooligosyltrehalose trehalohydrolase